MSDSSRHPHWLPRRADQPALAALVVMALAATVGWWAARGGLQGRLIEVDRAEPLAARFEVDLNAAEEPELMQLPGIGPKLARLIIESRQSAGPFADADDLLRVRGIGPKKLEQIRPYLRIGKADCEHPTGNTPEHHPKRSEGSPLPPSIPDSSLRSE